MSRKIVRDMKRSMSAGRPAAPLATQQLARESALALLERSITFGHRRLAVIRLAMAVNAGADLKPEHWRYCQEAAERSRDIALQTMMHGALKTASQTRAAAI